MDHFRIFKYFYYIRILNDQLRFVLILCISHTAVHIIIDFFLYSAVDLHAKGDNLENRGVLRP